MKFISTILILIRDSISFLIYIFIKIKGIFIKLNGLRVLVYHEISKENIPTSLDKYKLIINKNLFSRQMEFLYKHNYISLDFDSINLFLKGKKSINRNNVALTFDDGYKGVFLYAHPIFKKFDFKGCVFITVDFIDRKIECSQFCGISYGLKPLSWQEINILVDGHNFTVGSHSLTHCNFNEISKNEDVLSRELYESKMRIEKEIHDKVEAFSYPYGIISNFLLNCNKELRSAGYEMAFTNKSGLNKKGDSFYSIKRTRIYSDDNMFRFRMKLAGAYDWIDYIPINMRRIYRKRILKNVKGI